MPRIHIYSMKGRTLDQKRELVRRITDACVEVFNAKPESVNIYFQDVSPEESARAGVLKVDRPAKAAAAASDARSDGQA